MSDKTQTTQTTAQEVKALKESVEKKIKALEDNNKALTDQNTKLKSYLEEPVYGSASPGKIFAVARDPNDLRTKGFKNSREFLNQVMAWALNPHKAMDIRLKGLHVGLNDTHVKTVGSDEGSTISDPNGGFLIPIGFSPNLLKIDPEADPMAGKTTMIPMERPMIKIPARADKDHSSSVSGGLTVSRRPETVAAAASRMTLEQVSLEAHSLFGLSYASEELLNDSPSSFAAILAAGFSDQFTYQIINERLNGTGVGEYQGILGSPCLVSVAKESGQAATTLIYQNVLNMRARCWGYQKAIWLANHDSMPQLMALNQAVGLGGAIVWQPSAREDHPDMLLGRPLIFTEYAQTLGTQGDLILGNWSEYLEGLYQPLQSEESIHVRFVNHERTFKFWVRNAGSPWWRSALTPKNSTKTLSPFVVCDTRS